MTPINAYGSEATYKHFLTYYKNINKLFKNSTNLQKVWKNYLLSNAKQRIQYGGLNW